MATYLKHIPFVQKGDKIGPINLALSFEFTKLYKDRYVIIHRPSGS